MKINHAYIKNILLAVESEGDARPYLLDILKKLDLDDFNQEFLLHYEVLFDYGFIESTLEDHSIGVQQGAGGDIAWSNIPIRLTASGHEFIEAMNKIEIWEIIKKDFKESSIKTIFKVATDLAEGFAKQKVEKILSE